MFYEIELREQTIHGDFKEWAVVYKGEAIKLQGGVNRNVYACEARLQTVRPPFPLPPPHGLFTGFTGLACGSPRFPAPPGHERPA